MSGFGVNRLNKPTHSPEEGFVFVIETTTADETFTIPCQDVGTFDALVDWGDGSFSTITAFDDADLAHTYAEAGEHTIRITGTFPNIYFNSTGDKLKITKVRNLGKVGWLSLSRAFRDCENLTEFTVGNTDTSNVTAMDLMLRGTAVTVADLSRLDTSSVINMLGLFALSTSLTSVNVSSFNTANVARMLAFLNNCSSLQYIDVSNFDTSSVENFGLAFASLSSLTDIIGLDNFNIEAVTTLNNFANDTTIPTNRYDALLISWAAQSVNSGVTANFGNSTYTAGGAAEAARNTLINTYGWTITDGGAA